LRSGCPSASGGQARTFPNNIQVESQPFGMGVTYDLGGGASVAAGVVDPDRLGEDTRADVGVTFNF
jgi:hypothetical protein